MFFTHILNRRRIRTQNQLLPQCSVNPSLGLRHIVFQNYIFFSTFVFGYFLFCYVFGDKNNIYLKIITQILTGALWVAAMVYGTTSIVKGIFVRSYFCFCKHWTNPTTQTAQQRNKIVWRTHRWQLHPSHEPPTQIWVMKSDGRVETVVPQPRMIAGVAELNQWRRNGQWHTHKLQMIKGESLSLSLFYPLS